MKICFLCLSPLSPFIRAKNKRNYHRPKCSYSNESRPGIQRFLSWRVPASEKCVGWNFKGYSIDEKLFGSNKASGKLQQLAAKLKERYKPGSYEALQAEAIVRDAFKGLYLTRHEPLSTAINDDPQKFPANKKCWQRLVDDVTDCDEEVVIRSGLSLFSLIGGFGSYVISQGTAFYQRSKCVDRAQKITNAASLIQS